MLVSPRRKRFRTALFTIAALPGLAWSSPGYAIGMSPLGQQIGPQPPLPSVSQPSPTHPVDDIPLRHAQLENLGNDAERAQREARLAREQALLRLRERNERLTLDVQKILQLSMDLSKSVEQGEETASADRIQIARKLEKLAHEVRTTLANRGVSHPDSTRGKVAAKPASEDELRETSRQCVQLALQLKQHVDEMLDPRNQNTVSAAALKAPKARDKQQPSSSIMSAAENIEDLSYRISRSLRTPSLEEAIRDPR
jgi:hypothetical protein